MKKYQHTGIVLAQILTLLLLAGSILSWCISFVPPTEGHFWGIIALGTPVGIAANFFALIFWILLRRWSYVLLPIIALVFNLEYIISTFQFSFPKHEQADLIVGTLNVDNFLWQGEAQPCIDQCLEVARREQLDVFCLQEYTSVSKIPLDSIALSFASYLPYASFDQGEAILSRHPIVRSKYERFPDSGNDYLWADIALGKDTVRIISVHFQTSGISALRAQYEKTEEGKAPLSEVLGTLEKNNRKRATQAFDIREMIDATPYPLVVMGDFNDTPSSYTYRRVKNNLVDGFRQAGNGFARTFRGLFDFLRIDFIFYEELFYATDYKILEDNLSDHRMVTASLKFDR